MTFSTSINFEKKAFNKSIEELFPEPSIPTKTIDLPAKGILLVPTKDNPKNFLKALWKNLAKKIKFGIFLALVIIAILIVIKYVSLILHKFKLEYPSLIYSEGNSYNTIELTVKNKIKELESEKNLVQIVNNYDEECYFLK